jgi:hypothetical protein
MVASMGASVTTFESDCCDKMREEVHIMPVVVGGLQTGKGSK